MAVAVAMLVYSSGVGLKEGRNSLVESESECLVSRPFEGEAVSKCTDPRLELQYIEKYLACECQVQARTMERTRPTLRLRDCRRDLEHLRINGSLQLDTLQ